MKELHNISDKVETILEEDDLLQGFTFFFNKIENFRIARSEVRKSLEQFIRVPDDRHMLQDEDKIAFLDVFKIERIYDVTVNKQGIKFPISFKEFKRKYQKNLLKKDEWGEKYRAFIDLHKRGDDILEAVSPRQIWKQLFGSSFVVLERNGEAITVIIKSMN